MDFDGSRPVVGEIVLVATEEREEVHGSVADEEVGGEVREQKQHDVEEEARAVQLLDLLPYTGSVRVVGQRERLPVHRELTDAGC